MQNLFLMSIQCSVHIFNDYYAHNIRNMYLHFAFIINWRDKKKCFISFWFFPQTMCIGKDSRAETREPQYLLEKRRYKKKHRKKGNACNWFTYKHHLIKQSICSSRALPPLLYVTSKYAAYRHNSSA